MTGGEPGVNAPGVEGVATEWEEAKGVMRDEPREADGTVGFNDGEG